MNANAAMVRPSRRRAPAAWGIGGLVTVTVLVAVARAFASSGGDAGGAARPADVEPPAAIAAPSVADGAGSGASDGAGWAGFAVKPERPAPNVALIDQTGQPWSLERARGKVVALFFGYTRCPDVCPQTLALLQQAIARLGAAGDDVQVVLVTTDPVHDTPAVLAGYIGGYDPRFVALTGAEADVRAAADPYGALPDAPPAAAAAGAGIADHAAQAGHAEGATEGRSDGHADDHAGGEPSIDPTMHSSRVWLIDAAGQMRVSYSGPYTPADVAHDMAILIGERR